MGVKFGLVHYCKRLRVSENRILRRILGSKTDKRERRMEKTA
jgi:hypothetical protein